MLRDNEPSLKQTSATPLEDGLWRWSPPRGPSNVGDGDIVMSERHAAPQMRTPLCDLLGIEYPILSVGFGWGARAEL